MLKNISQVAGIWCWKESDKEGLAKMNCNEVSRYLGKIEKGSQTENSGVPERGDVLHQQDGEILPQTAMLVFSLTII